MSMINDALKRAKEAQANTPPSAPGPQLRPAEITPSAQAGGGIGMLAPVIIIAFALIGLLFIWHNRQKAAAREPVKDVTKPPVAVDPIPETKSVAPTVVATTPPATQPITAAPATSAPIAAPAPAPKLQSIFFLPGHSTAMISGKSVKAGDLYKGFRITAITQTSLTLASATQTNVLTLEQ